MNWKRTYQKLPESLLAILWLVGVLVVSFALMSAVHLKKELAVSETVISFENPSTQEHMLSIAEVGMVLDEYFGSDLTGVPVRHVDIDLLEELIETEDYVMDAEVYLDKINRLFIRVVEREPLLRVIREGESFYLDGEGVELPLSDYYTPRVPVVLGAVPTAESEGYGIFKTDLLRLVNALRSDPFLQSLTDQIVVRADGEYELLPLIGTERVLLGNLDDLDEKLKKYKAFYRQMMPLEGWKKYSAIDLRFRDQVVGLKDEKK